MAQPAINTDEVELTLMAALMAYPEARGQGNLAKLLPDHFASPAWGALYAAISDAETFEPLEMCRNPSVCVAARQAFQASNSGEYQASMLNVQGYAAEVMRLANDRRKAAALRTAQEVGTPEALMAAADAVAEVTVNEPKPIKEAAGRAYEWVEACLTGKDPSIAGTGFVDIDSQYGRWEPGNLVIIAGRPGMGKTSFVSDVVLRQARAGIPCAIITLEMSADELARRMVCSIARVSGTDIRAGSLPVHALRSIASAVAELVKLPITVVDLPSVTIGEIRSLTRTLARKGVRLVAIDYLQLVHADRTGVRYGSREQEVAAVSRGLKSAAKSSGIVVAAAAQINRESEKRGKSHRPTMSDLRESGQIEQDADVILLMHRPEYYDASDRPGTAECLIVKNRNGQTGSVDLSYAAQFTTFGDLDTRGYRNSNDTVEGEI